MAQLIDLILGNHLNAEELAEVGNICRACRDAGNAAAGEGDLGGGGKLKNHVGSSGLFAQGQNVREGDIFPTELMDAVGIVPHDGEIRSGRLQIGKPPDGFLAVDNAVGIGVFGHRPDELYLGILDKRFHQVHIRPLRGHGHGNQLRTEVLGDGEMPVIARGRAENLHFFLPAPGTGAVLQAVGVGPGDNIKHQIQAGHAAHKNIFGLAVQNLRPVPLGAGQTGQFTVIPGVHAVGDALGRIG